MSSVGHVKPDAVMDGSQIIDPMEDKFAFLVANGYSYTQAVKESNPDALAPHNIGARLAKLPRVQERIRHHATTAILPVKAESIREVAKRLDNLDTRWKELNQVKEDRAIDYTDNYPDVPGGQTGWLTWELKAIGSGESATVEKYHHVDYKLLAEIRDIERLAHEWDKRANNLKSLHMHAHLHSHGKSDPKLDESLAAMRPHQRKALAEAFPDIAEVVMEEPGE